MGVEDFVDHTAPAGEVVVLHKQVSAASLAYQQVVALCCLKASSATPPNWTGPQSHSAHVSPERLVAVMSQPVLSMWSVSTSSCASLNQMESKWLGNYFKTLTLFFLCVCIASYHSNYLYILLKMMLYLFLRTKLSVPIPTFNKSFAHACLNT